MDDKNMSIVEHLAELRKVLIISIIAIITGGIICFFVWGDLLFDIVTDPLAEFDVSLVYISMTEAFITKIKISLVAGTVLVSPIVFWQIWSYIVPALHQNEKKIVLTLLPVSIVLFISGILFAYFTVFRFAAGFLLLVAGEGLEAMISVSRYVSFLLGFLLPFGIIFQMPLGCQYYVTGKGQFSTVNITLSLNSQAFPKNGPQLPRQGGCYRQPGTTIDQLILTLDYSKLCTIKFLFQKNSYIFSSKTL
jgi:Tat protein translocase TatC